MIEEQIERFVVEGARSINERNWEAYGRLFAKDLSIRAPALAGVATGRQVRVAMVQGIIAAFSNGQVELERSFGQGNWACIQVNFTGTHDGPLVTPDGGEIPATNKQVSFPYCIVAKFEDDEVTEIYEYFDQLELLTQLGAIS